MMYSHCVKQSELELRKLIKQELLMEYCIQLSVQAWCTPETETIVMIPELAKAFSDILFKLMSQLPHPQVWASESPYVKIKITYEDSLCNIL